MHRPISILITTIVLTKTISTLYVADGFNDDQNKTHLQHHQELMQGRTSLNDVLCVWHCDTPIASCKTNALHAIPQLIKLTSRERFPISTDFSEDSQLVILLNVKGKVGENVVLLTSYCDDTSLVVTIL